MSEREYIKYNTSIQVASNSGTLQKDDEGNLAAIVELRLPDNIFPAESGKKKVDSVQMLTTKMRISMENTPIAQFDVDEATMTKLEKLKKGPNAAFITTSQLDLYPYVIKGDNQILPSKTNSAFPSYKSQVLSIDISVWMGEDYVSLDTLYVHPNAPSSFAEDVGRYQEPFKKGGVFAALNHLSNLVVKQYMPVKRENDTVSIFNVGSIEQMLQDGIESAMIYNNTSLENPLQYSIFFISEEAYNNNQFPPVEVNDFTKDDVDVENTLTLAEFGGMKAYFVKKIFGPDYNLQTTDLPNIRYSVKPKVSFTEQKLRISYDTCPFVNNIPILWCNSYVNTFDNPLQLTMGELYNEYSDGFKPPKRVYSYGVTKNEDNSYFFTLQQSTINPINIVGNKDLRDTFSCLPWITVNTNTNGFFNSKAKAKYRINEQSQVKTVTHSLDVTTVKWPEAAPAGTKWRQYRCAGIDCRSFDSALTENCLIYSFTIPRNAVNTTGTTFNRKYPKAKRMYQTVQWGNETRMANASITKKKKKSRGRSNDETIETMSEMKTYNQYEYNYNETFPSTDVQEFYSSSSTEITVLPSEFRSQACCAYFNINGRDELLLYDIPEGGWSSRSPWRCWLPPVEPDFVQPPIEGGGGNLVVTAYWNLPQTGVYQGKIMLGDDNWLYWTVSYDEEVNVTKTYYKQNVIETLTTESVDDLLFNFLPNVDLDEKGRFYLLDGTTTNLSMGQQEVIEGANYSLFDISTTTTVTTENRTITENWGGTKDGEPYERTYEKDYRLINMEPVDPYLFYRYKKIDTNQSDTPENRTNQFIFYQYVNIREPFSSSVISSSAANLQSTQRINGQSQTTTNVSHESSSSSEYPVGTTTLPTKYTNWVTIDGSQTILLDETVITSIGGYNVSYPVNSSDEYWDLEHEQISDDPKFRCIPNIPCDLYEEDNEWIQQRWTLQKHGLSVFLREKREITSRVTSSERRKVTRTTISVVDNSVNEWFGNIRVNFEWDNIPIVVISPIQSIVLTLQGMNVSQEFQPINVAQAGGSSLTSTIPVIENYYSLAQTIRDLHDELVVIKDSYDDQPCYSLSTVDGQARALRLEAHYITKDGRLHQIYIPPNGVFSLQLTFGISYYFTS